ncbi:RND efflux system, outer membrane lipoprotein CmeC [plant metagenome]|uniref:RND efflux system, outer membrane lipoprotein CmeC n=1 Tax=plant metagenome TaxID=1297885 RepID=A0A484R9Y0_9ZZZZ
MKHIRLRLFPLVLACLSLASCVTAADPPLQALRVPDRYEQDGASQDVAVPSAAPTGRAAAVQPWWRGFGDVRLVRLVERVMAVNPDLVSASLALRKARLQAGLARNDQWPQPGGSLGSSASRALDGASATRYGSDAALSLSWEVDLWGRLRAARDVAQWEAEASAEDRHGVALALAGEACRQYWNLAYLNQSIDAGDAHVAQLARTLELVGAQFQAGEVSLLALREAEQNLASQRVAQSALLQQRTEARNAMTALLDGRPWPREEEPRGLAGALGLAVAPGLPAELLGRRPDLRAAELRLRKASASIEAATRSYYPALTLTGSAGTSSTALSGFLSNPFAALGAGVTLPFLNVGRMRLDTDIARTDYETAASDFRGAFHAALQEVGDALAARGQLAVQEAEAQRSFDAAADVERMYGVQYRAGGAGLRVWLEAQQTLREAELVLAQIRRDQRLNDVTLQLALGGDTGQAAQAGPP